jgi:hypothetical protein
MECDLYGSGLRALELVRVTIVIVEKSNKYYMFCMCVCSLSYPAYKAHAPSYIVICHLSGPTVFFLFTIHRILFR